MAIIFTSVRRIHSGSPVNKDSLSVTPHIHNTLFLYKRKQKQNNNQWMNKVVSCAYCSRTSHFVKCYLQQVFFLINTLANSNRWVILLLNNHVNFGTAGLLLSTLVQGYWQFTIYNTWLCVAPLAFLVDSEAQPQNCFDMYEAVICNQFTENAYMPCVVCTVFGSACWLTMLSSRSVLIFMKPKRCSLWKGWKRQC